MPVDFSKPLPGVYDTIARCLIDELMRRLGSYHFVSHGGWMISIHVHDLLTNSPGEIMAQIGFLDDEIHLYLWPPRTLGDRVTIRYGKGFAKLCHNFSDPNFTIEHAASTIVCALVVHGILYDTTFDQEIGPDGHPSGSVPSHEADCDGPA